MLASGRGSITITVNDADTTAVRDDDEVSGNIDPARFRLLESDRTTIVGGLGGANDVTVPGGSPHGTNVDFTVTTAGNYYVQSETGGIPIGGSGAATDNDDDNGFSITVSRQGGYIGFDQTSLQQNTGGNVNLDFYFLVGAGYANLVAAINSAIASRPDLTFDGTTLTYAPVADYTATYNPTGGGFLDISGTGTGLNLGDEQNSLRNIGFSFDFYGTARTQLYVHDNGYVTFGSGTNQYNNVTMAAGTALGGRPAIAAYWDDLDPAAAGDVYVQTIGTAGNREFIIQWNNVPYYNGGTTETGRFQIVLSEATGEIEFRYDDTDFNGTGHDNGVSATIAIQNGSGVATQHSFNTGQRGPAARR